MILRRFYFKGRQYAWYFHPELTTWHDLATFTEENPKVNGWALDNATYFFDKLNRTEQRTFWKQTHTMVMNHTRWVLDNLDNMCEYKVGWNNYGSHNGTTIGKPPEIETKSSAKEEMERDMPQY